MRMSNFLTRFSLPKLSTRRDGTGGFNLPGNTLDKTYEFTEHRLVQRKISRSWPRYHVRQTPPLIDS